MKTALIILRKFGILELIIKDTKIKAYNLHPIVYKEILKAGYIIESKPGQPYTIKECLEVY